MPHFTFRNVPEKQVKEWSNTLLAEIATTLSVPEYRVTFSHVDGKSFLHGEDISDKTAFVEIHWLPRPTDKKIEVSTLVSNALIEKGYDNPIIWYHEFGPESCWYQGEFLTKPPIIE